MTVSFHRYDLKTGFFPGTGAIDEVGEKTGKYYSLNVPLQENIDDATYYYTFTGVMDRVMSVYNPSVVVLQCGADSLAGDRLGCFNLSIKGHGSCVDYMRSKNVPMLVVGGGGYTIRNVARCWTYETAVLTQSLDLQEQFDPVIPPNSIYYGHFSPDYKLHSEIVDKSLPNRNDSTYINEIQRKVYEYLSYIQSSPSVQMKEVPPSFQNVMGGGMEWDKDRQVEEVEDTDPERRLEFGLSNSRENGAIRKTKEKQTIDGREYY